MFSPWRLAAGLPFGHWALRRGCRRRLRNWCGIGAAHFPPYTVRPEQGADTGLLPQLVEALNASQTDYQFVLVPTSIPRRFRDFEQGRIDMAIFENPAWGWQKIPHTSVDMGLEDAEIFVAQREPGRARTISPTLRANAWRCSAVITTPSPASTPTPRTWPSTSTPP